ncbi:MAG: aminopeptidase P N-terminal domain-containing protein [Myxococcales bacterium]|nr:aminopeptidase P N-terminal domain-containing protein [Myxococcales bacterium]
MYAERRRALMDRMKDASAVFFAAPETIRNNDVHHEYRQDSDFFYLTGFEEPEAVLVLAPHREPGSQVALFLRTRDPEREVWDGERLGVERAAEALGVDCAHPIDELSLRLSEYLVGAPRLYHAFGREGRHADDGAVLAALTAARRERRKGHDTPGDLLDPAGLLHEQRLRKDEACLDAMRRAAALTNEGHRAAMAVTAPGRREYELRAAMEFEWSTRGAGRNAYPSIVGSGPNACILHYRAGSRPLGDGELVLVDAGCEVDYHACDVTRTWPVSGKFSDEQRAIYEVVLESQKAAIALCKPGFDINIVHDRAVRTLVEGLVKLGLLEGEVEALIKEEKFKRFYMHRTSHWLGMDVHDVGAYYLRGTPRPFEPGMVLTVEPGLYVSPSDTEVEARWRGIGVRIEDDVLITAGEPEVLTAAIPKEVADVEAAVGLRAQA